MSAPSAFRQLLGSTFVQRYDEGILSIGGRTFSRYELTHDLDCAASSRAAGILTRALKELGITTAKAALNVSPIDLASIDGVGVTAIYVFLCWQRRERGRGITDWTGQTDVTVSTLKERVRKRKARDAEPTKRARRVA